jgi:hypothetical protein
LKHYNVPFTGTPFQYLQGRSSMGFQSWEFSCSGLIDSYNFNIEVFMFRSSDSCSFNVSKSPHVLVPRTPHLHIKSSCSGTKDSDNTYIWKSAISDIKDSYGPTTTVLHLRSSGPGFKTNIFLTSTVGLLMFWLQRLQHLQLNSSSSAPWVQGTVGVLMYW